MFQLVALVVAVTAGGSYGMINIAGVHSGGYTQGATSGGCFYSDATSLINFVGTMSTWVGNNCVWQVFNSNVNVESGSIQYVGYPCGAGGQDYASVVYANSSVRLTANSWMRNCDYTITDVRFSTTQLDGSTFFLNDSSTAYISQSNMQLKGSTIQFDQLSQFILKGAAVFTLISSSIKSGRFNQFDLQGSTMTLTSSSITTGQGCQFLMAPKSTLLANNLVIRMADYSTFDMAAGSNLLTMGSSSSISLGKKAELQITGNCVFSGNLNVADRILKVVNSSTTDSGFMCFPTELAMQLFVKNLSGYHIADHV